MNMNTAAKPLQAIIAKGRPRKYSEYERLYDSLEKGMKRPSYVNNIGIMRGLKRDSVYIKICMTNGGVLNGKTYKRGDYVEINLGKLSSFTWPQLEERLNQYQGKADRGEPLEEKEMETFSSYAQGWQTRANTRVKSKGTLRYHIGRYLIPKFGNKALDSISTADVNNWIAELRESLNPATVKRIFNTLRAVLNDAIKSGVIHHNPCMNADRITGIVARGRYLDPEEIILLYTAAKEKRADWLADFILWAIHSGMRKGEIRSLTWEDIRTHSNGRVFAYLKTSKSGKPRMVECTKTMQEILNRQSKRKRKANNKIFSTPLITLTRYWKEIKDKVNIPDVTLHDLRRTHVTHIAAANVDLNTLATRIGHADLTMMQKCYAVVIGETDSKATKTIENVFSSILKAEKNEHTRAKSNRLGAAKHISKTA